MKTKLKIEHLVPYFPYGLKCQVTDRGKKTIAELNGVYSDGHCTFHDIVESEKGFSEIRPILKPMDNFNRAYINELAKFIVEIDSKYTVEIATKMLETYKSKPSFIPYIVLNRFFEWHFDVFGLIEKGLAIDINDL